MKVESVDDSDPQRIIIWLKDARGRVVNLISGIYDLLLATLLAFWLSPGVTGDDIESLFSSGDMQFISIVHVMLIVLVTWLLVAYTGGHRKTVTIDKPRGVVTVTDRVIVIPRLRSFPLWLRRIPLQSIAGISANGPRYRRYFGRTVKSFWCITNLAEVRLQLSTAGPGGSTRIASSATWSSLQPSFAKPRAYQGSSQELRPHRPPSSSGLAPPAQRRRPAPTLPTQRRSPARPRA